MFFWNPFFLQNKGMLLWCYYWQPSSSALGRWRYFLWRRWLIYYQILARRLGWLTWLPWLTLKESRAWLAFKESTATNIITIKSGLAFKKRKACLYFKEKLAPRERSEFFQRKQGAWILSKQKSKNNKNRPNSIFMQKKAENSKAKRNHKFP